MVMQMVMMMMMRMMKMMKMMMVMIMMIIMARSPLSVALGGLDMMKEEIKSLNASADLIDLLNDVYEANQAAVFIMNDLLNFESMDAGSFTVDLKACRVDGVFQGKLGALTVSWLLYFVIVRTCMHSQKRNGLVC